LAIQGAPAGTRNVLGRAPSSANLIPAQEEPMAAPKRLFTDASRTYLVPEESSAAAFLIKEHEAEAAGIAPATAAQLAALEGKAAPKPADKAVKPAANKAAKPSSKK
jgi:hypothetical protein